MTTLRVEPVLEVLGGTEIELWPVVGRDGFWYLALHGDLTKREVGTAVHQILRWFYTDDEGDPASTVEEYLARALAPYDADDARPLAMGGMQFTDTVTGSTILPGCCYSIDERSELVDVLGGRTATCWFGHDPDAVLTVRDGLVEIVQDAQDLSRPVLRFPLDQVRVALARAEEDLDRFCDLVTTWAAEHTPAHADALPAGVTRALSAGSHRSTDDAKAWTDTSADRSGS